MRHRGSLLSRISSTVSSPEKKQKQIFGISVSLILINMVSIMERADENLLPAVYKEASEAFNAGPTDLGYLTLIRNFSQALSSPLAGILALHYNRPTILALGTACWSISTAAVGVSQHFQQVAFWRALNGFGLAIVIPALQSFIADSYREGSRGTGFGALSFVGSIGGIGGGVVATVMAGQEYWGISGWRFAFLLMAALSLLIGILVFFFVVDPRKSSVIAFGISADSQSLLWKTTPASLPFWVDLWIAMKSVMRIKTFQIIVLQGIVGSFPWTAMVFFTMWFELIGFDNKYSAALTSIFAIGCACGSFMGGFLADKASVIYPDTGRIMCAQLSAFMGVPFSWLLLFIIPQSVDSWNAYALTLFLMGLTISWCSSINNPMFAEVVQAKHRTMIYAFDRAFEGSFASFAAPAVGMLSERVYGYDSSLPKGSSANQAIALSRGLLSMMTLPFGLCAVFYTLLYATFKRDRDTVKMAMAGSKEQEQELT